MTKEEALEKAKSYRNEWENSGWDKLWKYFIDSFIIPAIEVRWEEKSSEQPSIFDGTDFYIDSKEKYGTLRVDVYPYYLVSNTDAEFFLNSFSEFTCINCGKQPKNSKGEHIIWKTRGWIAPYCKECARKIFYNDVKDDLEGIPDIDRRRLTLMKYRASGEYNKDFKNYFRKDTLKHNIFGYTIFSKDEKINQSFIWHPDGETERLPKTIIKTRS